MVNNFNGLRTQLRKFVPKKKVVNAPKPKLFLVEEAQPFEKDIKQQIQLEVGDEELSTKETLMLKQKFGLVVPLLTYNDLEVINRE